MVKKNKQIILFMSDTTRKDMLGFYNSDMHTPNIDSLARDGLSFENAYSCQPVCGPARSAIFTGLFPHSNGIVANSIALAKDVKTIGERLNKNEIHCAYVGKYHIDGGDYFGYGKCPNGWDNEYWFDQKNYLDSLSSDKERIASRNPSTSFEEWLTEEFTYAHKTSDIAIRFLKENINEDFFLTVSYDEPHDPCICPKPFNKMYENYQFPNYPNFYDSLDDKPFLQKLWAADDLNKTGETLNNPSTYRSLFLGCNSYMDYELGRVLDIINKNYPDAMVIYTSDHGDMLGSHKLHNKDAAAYKEIANIPLIIRGGDKGTTTAMASHIDLVPTILDYFNLQIPKTLQGKSMLPQVHDKSVEINDAVYVEWTRYEVDHDAFGGLQMMRSIVTKKLKLVINLMDTDELYDLSKDPFEMNNLIYNSDYIVKRNLLHDELLTHMNETRDPYRGYQWAIRSWRKDKIADWEGDGYTRQKESELGQEAQLDYDTGLPVKKTVRKKRKLEY